MKKKTVLSMLFIISLIPMLFNQYGGAKGVQEITGLINLFNPVGIISFILFFIIWLPLKNNKVNRILGATGVIGIVLSEIFTFLTWYIPIDEDSISLKHSLNNAFPEFYIGLIVSLCMVAIYFVIDKKVINRDIKND